MNEGKGTLVAFWSPWEMGSLTSACLTAMAAAFQEKTTGKIALVSVKRSVLGIEHMLLHAKKMESVLEDKKSGISALIQNFKQAKLNTERILSCGIPLENSNIHLFPGEAQEKQSTDNKEKQEILSFLLAHKITEAYEWVFVELPTGTSKLSLNLIETADIVFVVLPQQPELWKEYFSFNPIKKGEKLILYMLGDYMHTSKFNRHYFALRYHKDLHNAGFGVVSSNTGYKDACIEGKVLEFFNQNKYARTKEENHSFLCELRDLAKQMINLQTKENQSSKTRECKEHVICGDF